MECDLLDRGEEGAESRVAVDRIHLLSWSTRDQMACVESCAQKQGGVR